MRAHDDRRDLSGSGILAMKRCSSSTMSLFLVLLPLAAAAEGHAAAANYLVYVDPHPPGVDGQVYQLGILAAALGGEEKAKAALLYNYKNVMSGFSARLTPSELEAVKRQPQVNRVLPSSTLRLMSSNFDGVS